jgi:hypothetical protein
LKEEKKMLKKNGKERRSLDGISKRLVAVVADGFVVLEVTRYWTPQSPRLNGRSIDEFQRSPEDLGMSENWSSNELRSVD